MAIEAEELSAITRGIRNAGMETAGEFRQAANASNANLSRIVKDISTTFKAQREDIADLHNVLEEMVSESQQTGNKIDSLNSLFRESLEIQNSMRTEISNVTRNTRTLSGDIESLNRNIMNNTSSGLLGSITNIGQNVADKLLAAGIFAAAGATAANVMSSGGGGGGGMSPAIPFSGPNKPILDTIKERESSNNYQAQAKTSSASGAYQFIDETWQTWQRKSGVGTNYARAKDAPPEIQDKVADAYVSDILKRAGGDVSKVPLEWFTGNLQGRMSAKQQAANPGVTAESYQAKWLRDFSKHGGKAAMTAAATQAPTTPTTPSAPTATPTATPVSTPEVIPSANDPRTERIGKEGGHGPISGVAHEGHGHDGHGEQVGASLPAGDVVALGHALEKMGMRISEHPQFGGVKPVHKGKAHYEGRAIDINFGEGNVEARDPVMGAKFDQLAEQLTRLGYKVYWRESGPYAAAGHNNHLHAEIPKGGAPSVPDTYQVAGSPEQRALQGATPAVGTTTSMAPPAASPMAAEPVAQAPISPGISAPPAGANMMGQMMGMMPGMMGGGIGGIAGMLLPMITSAIQSELVSTPSMPALNTQTLNQAAVTSQATEQTIQEAQGSFFNPQVNVEPNRMTATNQSGFAYNMPGDIEWPDWASMLGGNHYEEMKNYKKNMSWG
jgi:hypothetical protein